MRICHAAIVSRGHIRRRSLFAILSSSLPFVPFCHDKQSNSTRRYLHLRRDTHCDDDCKRSNAPNQLNKKVANKQQQKEEPRCWPVREGWMFQGQRGWNCAVGDFFWGSLAGLFRGGNTFFPGGVWGTRIWRCPALEQIKITPTTPQLLFGSGAFDWRESCRLVGGALFLKSIYINSLFGISSE